MREFGTSTIKAVENQKVSTDYSAAALFGAGRVAKGMRVLGNPLPGDSQVISGESGAATSGLLAEVMMREELKSLRDGLGLGPDSGVICFSTEGNTDEAGYRRIVWDGAYSSELT